MLRRYRRFLILLSIAAFAGVGVTLAPMTGGHPATCSSLGSTILTCYPATNVPDLVAGVWAAITVYVLLAGLVLSARALAHD